LFEIKRKTQLYGFHKPGQVKSGQTWAKLSSAKDPCRYRPESTLTKEEGISSDQGAGGNEEEESGEWKWHAEEDFTLERAWPKGHELFRAIVYVSSFEDDGWPASHNSIASQSHDSGTYHSQHVALSQTKRRIKCTLRL
jgi:hypothetical protein